MGCRHMRAVSQCQIFKLEVFKFAICGMKAGDRSKPKLWVYPSGGPFCPVHVGAPWDLRKFTEGIMAGSR